MRPQDPSGFAGANKTMLLRTKESRREQKGIGIDWEVWGEGEEVLMRREGEEEGGGGGEEEISGPWMDRWRR